MSLVRSLFKIKEIFFFFCFLQIIVFFCLWNNSRLVDLQIYLSSGSNYTLTLPNRDKARLDYFFRELMLHDGAIYTLVGNKPISLGGYFKPNQSFFLRIYQSLFSSDFKMFLGLQIWLKYQHLFPHSKFLLWVEQSPWIEKANIILFVNKEKAASLVKNYSQDFCTVLEQDEISLDELLRRSKNYPFFLTVLKKHEGLIGTLLGYGRENAWLFHRRDLGEDISLSGWDQSEIFSYWQVKRRFFKNKWQDISKSLFLPCFAADLNSEETKELKKDYQATREKIIATYKDKDFLETTLSLLMN